MNIFFKIIQSGTIPNGDYSENRSIIISNYIALILSGAVTLLYIQRTVFYGNVKYGINTTDLIFALIVFLTPLLLNKLHYTTVSRFLSCIIPILFIWGIYILKMQSFSNIEPSYYDSMRIFLLSASPLPFLIFNVNKIRIFIIVILPSLFSFLFFETLLELAHVGPLQKGVSGQDYQLMGMRTFVSYIIISASCYAFQYIISENDKLNVKILGKLKQKAFVIESQNSQLKSNHEELNVLNRKLIGLVAEKSESIKSQNEKILSYAYSNSHEVRASVARILGLIEVSKLEADINYPWYLEKIKHEAQKLDETIKTINNKLEPDQN